MAQEICVRTERSEGEYDLIKSIVRSYNIKEYSTRAAAEAALQGHASCPIADPDYPTLIRRPFSVEQKKEGVTNYWTARVTWEEFIPPTVGREILTGSISTGTQRVKSTFNHVGSYGPGSDPAMNSGGGINVTSDGVEGADLEFPVLGFSLSRLYAKGTFTLAWLANAMAYAQKPNTTGWRGFSPGEVKLVAVDGTDDSTDYDNITFTFSASPTFTNIQIPSPLGTITVPSKAGWQYLHIQYIERHDPTTGFTTLVPHTAHVDELVPGIDLNGLV